MQAKFWWEECRQNFGGRNAGKILVGGMQAKFWWEECREEAQGLGIAFHTHTIPVY
jgi:hypothetical protein